MHELTGVTVQLGREQRLAGGHWLLGAAPSLQEARADWEESGSAWLRPGVLFGAVVIRAGVVHAALGTDSPMVTDALLAGDFTPLWEDGKRRERKVQVFPDQFTPLFGVELATGGRAAGLLFPRVEANGSPDVVDGAQTLGLGDDDFMSGATEDRYPDIFELARGVDGGGRRSARDEVSARLAMMPHLRVRLSHDVPASVAALEKVAGTV